jgi:hypothetical protein
MTGRIIQHRSPRTSRRVRRLNASTAWETGGPRASSEPRERLAIPSRCVSARPLWTLGSLSSFPEGESGWRVTHCNIHFIEDKKEWKDTRVVFDISSDGAATTVTMTHAGLAPGVECYENCRNGWNFYITESLQKLLAENQGIPDGQRRQESAEKAGAETR